MLILLNKIQNQPNLPYEKANFTQTAAVFINALFDFYGHWANQLQQFKCFFKKSQF